MSHERTHESELRAVDRARLRAPTNTLRTTTNDYERLPTHYERASLLIIHPLFARLSHTLSKEAERAQEK